MDIPNPKSILIIDDDVNIRLVIKKLFVAYLSKVKIYSENTGIEGLGLAYIIKPDIIILDTTLPRYSGREIIDYLTTNSAFLHTRIILLHEENDISHLNKLGFTILSKKDNDFLEKLMNTMKLYIWSKAQKPLYKSSLALGKRIIYFANLSDNEVRNIKDGSIILRVRSTINFAFNQIFTSFFLTIFLIIQGRNNPEEEVSEDKEVFKLYRSRIYPTFLLLVIVTAIVLLIILQILFIVDRFVM